MSNRCVFFDRDGTINIDKGYIFKKEDFVFRDGIVDSIIRLKNAGYMIIVVTNQSGIARGLYSENDVIALHTYINEYLAGFSTKIDAFYYCPHYINGKIKKYSIKCDCRKPNPGMFYYAQKDYDIDLSSSYMIGDKESDIIAAMRAGINDTFIINNNNLSKIIDKILK